MLPSITLRGEMGTGIPRRAEKYQAAVNINLFHCCRVCASVLKQKRIRLPTGSPSAFGKWCWGRALLSAWLDSLLVFGDLIHAFRHEPNYRIEHGTKSPESALTSSVSNSLSAPVSKGRAAKTHIGDRWNLSQ